MTEPRSPVIVIGCGNSGTSLIAGMLEELGVFMGKEHARPQPRNRSSMESTFFVRVDMTLLNLAALIFRFDQIISNKEMRKAMGDWVRLILKSEEVISYLGKDKYETYRTPLNLDIPWGWKLISCIITLPIWLDVFPATKVIHVIRNGVDVIGGIKRTGPVVFGKLREYLDHKIKTRGTIDKGDMFGDTVDVVGGEQFIGLSLLPKEELFQFIWENGTALADKRMELLPQERKMEIRYETLLTDCRQVVESLCRFLELEPSSEKIKNIRRMVDPGRAYGFKKDPELLAFYQTVRNSPQMVKYGYSNLV